MHSYLLIETSTTWQSERVADFLDLAGALADAGHAVDLFLIQNGALMAYSDLEPQIARLSERAGLTVWVDDFSLASRSLPRALLEGVQIASADTLVRLLTRPDCKPIWH